MLAAPLHTRQSIERSPRRVRNAEFEDFGDKALSGTPLQVNENVQRIGNIGLDCDARQVHSALQDATRETREALLRRIRVNRGQSTGVTGVHELEKVERLTGADFPPR